MKLSVTIITYNEEHNIERAIKSADFADEVIIVDSHSKDHTCQIARKLDANIYKHEFEGYGQQKNYAASLTQGEWVLNIDADEEISKELQEEILEIIDNYSEGNPSVYAVPRLTKYVDRWIHHGGWYPNAVKRLCRKNHAQWTEPQVHEDLLPTNNSIKTSSLKNDLYHYSFPTIESQVRTNLRYAKLGAKDLIKRKARRPYLSEVLIRPVGKFFECYLWKRGFLDKTEGFFIAINAAHSMFLKYAIAYLDKIDD